MQGNQHLFWTFPGSMGLPVSQVPPSYPFPTYPHHPPSFQDTMNMISNSMIGIYLPNIFEHFPMLILIFWFLELANTTSFNVQTRSPQYNIKPTSQTSPPALSGGRSKERAPTHIQRNNSSSYLTVNICLPASVIF